MKKKQLLFVFTLLLASNVIGQNLPSDVTRLTPEGVKIIIDDAVRFNKQNALVVAGSPTAGYKAYFKASDAEHGDELWATDGTPAGTYMVKDIFPGPTGSDIAWMDRFNDKVVFRAQGNTNDGEALWLSDGTEAGKFVVKDIYEFCSSNTMGFYER